MTLMLLLRLFSSVSWSQTYQLRKDVKQDQDVGAINQNFRKAQLKGTDRETQDAGTQQFSGVCTSTQALLGATYIAGLGWDGSCGSVVTQNTVNNYSSSNTFNAAVVFNSSLTANGLSVMQDLIVRDTATIQGNAFSVGGTTFSVAGGSVTVGSFSQGPYQFNVIGGMKASGNSVFGSSLSVTSGGAAFTGNVGMGTASPAYPLHVAGDAYASGQGIAGGTMTVQGGSFSVATSTLAVSGGVIYVTTNTTAGNNNGAHMIMGGSGDTGYEVHESGTNDSFYFGFEPNHAPALISGSGASYIEIKPNGIPKDVFYIRGGNSGYGTFLAKGGEEIATDSTDPAILTIDGMATTPTALKTGSIFMETDASSSTLKFSPDGVNFVPINTAPSATLSYLTTSTFSVVGMTFFCSNCATSALCVSTGTAQGQVSDVAGRTAQCK